MRKGIIMEVQTKHWIILTSDGDFVKVPRTNLQKQLGDEIVFEEKKGFLKRRRSWLAIASGAVAAMLGIYFIIPAFSPKEANAETFIYVDVNPSIALGIDQNERVIQAKPLNKSGQKLLSKTNWQKESIDDVVMGLLDNARQEGYLQQKDQVILSGAIEAEKSRKTLSNLKTAIKEKSKKNHMELNVHTVTIPKEVQSQAEKTGLSPVKYTAWLMAKKEGKEISVEEIVEAPVNELVTDIKPVSEILDNTLSEQQWQQMISETGVIPTSIEENPDSSGTKSNDDSNGTELKPGFNTNDPIQAPNAQTGPQPMPSDSTNSNKSDSVQSKPGETNTGQPKTGTEMSTGVK